MSCSNRLTCHFQARDKGLILQVPISLPRGQDKWTWRLDPKSTYTIKSGYRFLANPHTQVPPSHHGCNWNIIWKLRTPAKVKNLIWRVCTTMKALWPSVAHRPNQTSVVFAEWCVMWVQPNFFSSPFSLKLIRATAYRFIQKKKI